MSLPVYMSTANSSVVPARSVAIDQEGEEIRIARAPCDVKTAAIALKMAADDDADRMRVRSNHPAARRSNHVSRSLQTIRDG